MKKKYYRSIACTEEQAANTESREISASELLNDNLNTGRRDFLKLFGFSIASAAVLSSCEQPVRKAIPYLVQPDDIVPGKAEYYASTYAEGGDHCSVLVKVRDGRPVKIEGNSLSTLTQGGTDARAQASVLNLYDNARLRAPILKGRESTWENTDKYVLEKLDALRNADKKVVLLTGSITGPSANALMRKFAEKYPNVRHVRYDAVSESGILHANEACFEKKVIPSYYFDKARVVVSFAADFLGSWLSPVQFTKQYSKARNPEQQGKNMLRHYHFESNMSLTGSNADKRILFETSRELSFLQELLSALTGKPDANNKIPELLLKDLKKYPGQSLIVSGSNNPECQALVNALNNYLGNYGNTIDLNQPLNIKQGDDSDLLALAVELEKGEIAGILCCNVNPVYDTPYGQMFEIGLRKTELSVTFAERPNETSELSDVVCASHNYLECWNDHEPVFGKFAFTQPAIRPLFNTRQAEDTLLTWCDITDDFRHFMKQTWEREMFPETEATDFYAFWTDCMQRGVYEKEIEEKPQAQLKNNSLLAAALQTHRQREQGLEVCFYENTSVGNGHFAGNPWLQELPDPISKVCWDNYAAVAPAFAKEHGLETGSMVKINGHTFPVLLQPGQHHNTIGIALGYGRRVAGVSGSHTGVNAYPLISVQNGYRNRVLTNVRFEKARGKYTLAQTQTHHSMEGRDIVREGTLDDFLRQPKLTVSLNEKQRQSLYPPKKYEGHRWAMAIDLNACTGCNACVVSCNAENNIPVVGKNEMARAHEMHWLRIDRYYAGDEVNPETVRQPVMCQHCDNAPCENVCPVAATNHSSEGLNQMIYNRCIGTRYCNNNCPYKVRRFNWFDYTGADPVKNNTRDAAGLTTELSRMVLNPDVTVRSQGVIEKCSFCIQRIQKKKLQAKLENRSLKDGDIVPACAGACPADAIVFGDLNDETSRIYHLYRSKRNYRLLDELNTLPSVVYLNKVRNLPVGESERHV